MLELQLIDDLKSRHQEELNKLTKSHNEQQIALSEEFTDKFTNLIKELKNGIKLFVTDDKNKTPQQKKETRTQLQFNFETNKKLLNKQKNERKIKLIQEYNQKKNELKNKQNEELRNIHSEKSEDPNSPKTQKPKKPQKTNNSKSGESYREYHIITWELTETVTSNSPLCLGHGDPIIHDKYNHGTSVDKNAMIVTHFCKGKQHSWQKYAWGRLWYLHIDGTMVYEYTRYIDGTRGFVNMKSLRDDAMFALGLFQDKKVHPNYVPMTAHNFWRSGKSPISDILKKVDVNYDNLDHPLRLHNVEGSTSIEITSRRFNDQPKDNGNGNGEEQEEENPEKKKKKKKYSLYEFKYDIVITYDDGSVLREPNKRIGLHESEFKIFVQDGPFGTSWYEDVTSYTYMKLRSEKTKKITYSKKQYVSEKPIASRRLVMIGVNQVKEVRIESVRKVKTIPCDQIINEDLMKILPYTSKLMTAGKATLESKIWSNFLVDKIFGGLLQERDLYDIPELTQEHCMNYVSNIDRSSNPDDFNDLLKSTEDNGEEDLSPEDNIYNKIVNANNNVLNLPARIVEQGEPVIKIPFGILFNFEMEADNDMKRFIAHFQQGAILAQKEIFGFITDFIVKTLTDNLPSLGAVTQGVLIPIEEKAQSDKPQSQSYFVPTPVATAVTASMQIAAIETIAQGTITTITGGLISGNLLVVMASQVTALIVEFLGLPGLNLVVVAAGQAVLATVKSLVYVLGEVIGKVAARVITWTLIALMDIVIVGAAVIVTQALRKPMTISDYAFILGINYGKPPDLHFFGLNQTNESDSHKELTEASKTFKENTGKTYDRVIGFAIAKDLKTQPITKKEIGAVIDLTNDNAIVISGKELKLLYALQFMYLFENVEEMQIPDRACVILPPPPQGGTNPNPSLPKPEDLINPLPKPNTDPFPKPS
jgi:hypothetical protein